MFSNYCYSQTRNWKQQKPKWMSSVEIFISLLSCETEQNKEGFLYLLYAVLVKCVLLLLHVVRTYNLIYSRIYSNFGEQ